MMRGIPDEYDACTPYRLLALSCKQMHVTAHWLSAYRRDDIKGAYRRRWPPYDAAACFSAAGALIYIHGLFMAAAASELGAALHDGRRATDIYLGHYRSFSCPVRHAR